MALQPSQIMAWQFHKERSVKKLNRDSYSKWKANEEAAKRRAEELRKCR